MRFNLSTNSEEQLIEHLGEEWEAIQGSLDALDLWNAIVATQNAVSTGNNDMDRIKMRRHLMLEMHPQYYHTEPGQTHDAFGGTWK
jgi:hypothetical protein